MKMRLILKPYIQPAFLLCIGVLAAAGGGMSTVKSYLGIKMIKLPLPLKKPLEQISEEKLAPYRVVNKQKIDNDDVLESLGTDEYIQWRLEDTEASPDSAVRYCDLFITYYTGTPDKVPHVPEECYFGGGNQRFEREGITLQVPIKSRTKATSEKGRPVARTHSVPATYLVFGSREKNIWDISSKFMVFYFFKVNGAYRGNRNTTRLELMSNITGKYSYFSKVEWKFFNNTSGGPVSPEKDQAIEAGIKLLSVILPVLETEHWPDWQKAIHKNKLQEKD